MRAWSRVALAMNCAIFLAGCHVSAKWPADRAQVPAGVLVSKHSRPGDDYRGLFIGHSTDMGCCLTTPHVTLSVEKKSIARYLVIVFYLPSTDRTVRSWFRRNPVTLIVTFPERKPEVKCCYGSGTDSARVLLPEGIRNKRGIITFSIQTKPGFIPAIIDPEKMKDRRSLGIILQRVFFY